MLCKPRIRPGCFRKKRITEFFLIYALSPFSLSVSIVLHTSLLETKLIIAGTYFSAKFT